MSRTYKDIPWKMRFPQHADINSRYNFYPYIREYKDYETKETKSKLAWFSVKKAGFFQKVKRTKNAQWHWMGSTPSWWINQMMTRPQRVASKKFEREIVKCNIEELEELDAPIIGRKPHIYYW